MMPLASSLAEIIHVINHSMPCSFSAVGAVSYQWPRWGLLVTVEGKWWRSTFSRVFCYDLEDARVECQGDVMKLYMLLPTVLVAVVCSLLAMPDANARSSKSSYGPGTGGASASAGVRGHITKKGVYVPPHRRTTPDKSINNNWSTKPNRNPYTGKEGSKIEPPPKP